MPDILIFSAQTLSTDVEDDMPSNCWVLREFRHTPNSIAGILALEKKNELKPDLAITEYYIHTAAGWEYTKSPVGKVDLNGIQDHAHQLFTVLRARGHNVKEMFGAEKYDNSQSKSKEYANYTSKNFLSQTAQPVTKKKDPAPISQDSKQRHIFVDMTDPNEKLLSVKIAHLENVKKALDEYIAWMNVNAAGTRFASRWSHWYHGDSGKRRAQEIRDLFKYTNGTDRDLGLVLINNYDDIMKKVNSAYYDSGIAQHSLSRYIHAAFSIGSLTEFATQFDTISTKADSKFKQEKNLERLTQGKINWQEINTYKGYGNA